MLGVQDGPHGVAWKQSAPWALLVWSDLLVHHFSMLDSYQNFGTVLFDLALFGVPNFPEVIKDTKIVGTLWKIS
jgi:hypothetical protein